MEITRNTELSELVPSDEIISDVTTLNTKVGSIISERIGVLNSEMSSGLSSSVLVNNEALFYNSATEIVSKYETVEDSLSTLVNSICNASISKEIEEIDELIIKLTEAKEECETNISTYEAQYTSNKNQLTSIDVKDLTVPYLISIICPFTTTTYTIGTAAQKLSAQADLASKYYGESGSITLEQQELSKWETKLEEARTRKSTLEGMSSSYSTSTADEYDDRGYKKGTAAASKDPNATYDNNGNKKTDTTTENPNVDTSKYTKYGTTGDGKTLYSDSNGYLYTIDENGNATKVKAVVTLSDGSNLEKDAKVDTEDGVNDLSYREDFNYYKIDDNTYTADDVTKSNTIPDSYSLVNTINQDGKEYKIYSEKTSIAENTTYHYEDEEGNVHDVDIKVSVKDSNGYGVTTTYTIDGKEYSTNEFLEIINPSTKTSTSTSSNTGGFTGASHSFTLDTNYTAAGKVTNSTGQEVQLYSFNGDDSMYYKDPSGDYKKAYSDGQGGYKIGDVIYYE